jgi:4-aminobutyrate aminotransferase
MVLQTNLRPGPKGQAIIERDTALMSGSMVPRYPFVMERGQGATVWDVDGNAYVDFAASIAVTST